jgi:TATA-box binding protein (TBP) (component of TFIID and TFIIIB)
VNVTKFTRYTWGRYGIEYYGGRCGYVKDKMMQGHVAVFFSGQMISAGANSISASIEQLEHTMEILGIEKFIERIRIEPKVQNVVATADLKSKIDLNRATSILTKFSLEPEQFPGAIYRSPQGPTCLIFASGKIVIAGAKSEKQVIDTEMSLLKLLSRFFI